MKKNPFVKFFTSSRISLWLIIVICCQFLWVNQLFPGAWTQKKGGYFLKVSGNYLFAKHEFNYLGKRINILEDYEVYKNTSFQDFSTTLYAEYGLNNWFTVIANLPFKVSTTERTETGVNYFTKRIVTVTTSGFSDLTLSGKVGILRKPLVFSVQSGVKIPLGYNRIPENDGAALGTAEVDGEGYLLLGKSLYPLPLYLTGGLGYRRRGGALRDEYLFAAEAGVSGRSWLFKVTFDGVKNTGTPPDLYGSLIITPLPGGGGAFPTILYGDQDYFKVSPGIIYDLKENLAVQLEAIHIAAGKNIISGTTYSLGIVLQR